MYSNSQVDLGDYEDESMIGSSNKHIKSKVKFSENFGDTSQEDENDELA